MYEEKENSFKHCMRAVLCAAFSHPKDGSIAVEFERFQGSLSTGNSSQCSSNTALGLCSLYGVLILYLHVMSYCILSYISPSMLQLKLRKQLKKVNSS